MADEKESSDSENKNSGHGKLLIIIIILLVLLLAGGGAFVAMTMMNPPQQQEQQQQQQPQPQAAALGPPSFMVLEPFIITLKSDARPRYMQIKQSLMVRDETVIATLEAYRPLIRNEVINYLGSLSFEEVKAGGVTEIIRAETLARVNALLDKERVGARVEDCLITDLVIQ
ncbi:flagellar basal body-associated FliL family protein [Endozoicomonas sp. 8E]|uniref:flagellar basal body-associated FliL family protein n=1 Tax=Endozoicomonas sp. 8E TaxID=3035692 RepID=UPI002938D320|nr:flagellar basal body-associated FliL family protein [Endozoicomonas sp. 8E]WOG29102.1 flagellar basal body-associated FliL family protein [Endozoicomonas sp. 8E]